jgi:hypothetical protein
MSEGVDSEWTVTGSARAPRVLGAHARLDRDVVTWWVDRARSTLWEVLSSGHLQATRLDLFTVTELPVARASETVVAAVFLGASSPSVALVLQRPSAGLERVVLVRLDGASITELAKSRPLGFELYAALDGSRLLLAHSSSTTVQSFGPDGTKGETFDVATPPFERDHWVLVDADTWLSIDGQRIERGALGQRASVLREGDFGAIQRLLGVIGDGSLAYITRVVEQRVLRVIDADGGALFELPLGERHARVPAFDAEGPLYLLSPDVCARRVDGTVAHDVAPPGESWLGLWRGQLVSRRGRSLVVRDVRSSDKEAGSVGDARPVTSLGLSRDGRRAITVEAGDRLRCYDLDDETIVQELAVDGTWWLAGMCEGDRAAALVRRDAVDLGVSLWRPADDCASLTEVLSLDPSTAPRVLAVSCDGSRVAVGSMDRAGLVVHSRRSDEEPQTVLACGLPIAARFVSDDRAMVVREALAQRWLSLDPREVEQARVTEEKSAEEARFVRISAAVTAVSEDDDTPSVSLSVERGRSQWEDGAMLRRRIHALAVADTVALAAVALSPSITIVVLDAHGTELARVERRKSTADRVTQMAFSEDGRRLVAGTEGGQLIVVDLELSSR